MRVLRRRGWIVTGLVLACLVGWVVYDRIPRTYGIVEGPLRVDPGGGSASLWVPRARGHWGEYWDGTFGWNLLCRADPDDEIVLVGVRVISGFRASGTRAVLRTLPEASAQRNAARGREELNYPVVSMDGSIYPGSWRRWPSDRLDGTYRTPVRGHRVTQSCGARESNNDHGFQELLLVLRADEAGSAVSEIEIAYEVNGRPRRVRTRTNDWSVILCGDEVDDWLSTHDPSMIGTCEGRRARGQ